MPRIAALAAALGLLAAPQEKADPPAPEQVHTVQRGNLVPALELDALFDAAETLEVRLRTEAYSGEFVVARAAAHGEAVRKGDVVLAFQAAALQRQIDTSEGDDRLAASSLRKAESDSYLGEKGDSLALDSGQAALRNAESDLKVFDEVEGKQMLRRAELSVKSIEDYVSDQEEELAQLEKMYKSEELTNATAEIVVRRAKRSLERLRVSLDMTRETARVVKDVSHPEHRRKHVHAVETARQALDALRAAQAHAKVQRETELARARAAAERAKDSLEKLRRDLEALAVKAPFDGRVFHGQFLNGLWATADMIGTLLRPGEKLQPGQTLLTVCGARALVRADLPEAAYFDVFPDQPAAVVPAALPDLRLEGQVRDRSASSRQRGAAPAFEARIELKESRPEILPGMRAKVTLTGKELPDAILVPSKALSQSGGKPTVSILKNGKGVPREVVVGKSDGKVTQIRSGLDAGEQIVLPR